MPGHLETTADVQTIYAVSSGKPPAAIAVLRISGPVASDVGRALIRRLPAPRAAALRNIRADDGEILDQGLILWFPGPDTATGEDLLELHLHGGRAVVARVEQAIAAVPGTRPALPGEFTRRSLIHGRVDLAEAEGLADLLAAETEQQRRSAMYRTQGELSRTIRGLLDRLSGIAARIEAEIEFSDDQDVPALLLDSVLQDITYWRSDVEKLLAAPSVELIRQGVRVVLAGRPNAGKSSLLNALASQDAAIVTSIAGTTRDCIEVPVVRDGVAYTLVDTAGLNASAIDPVERIGIERSRAAFESADIILALDESFEASSNSTILIYPRCDLQDRTNPGERLPVSVKRPDTINDLWAAIAGASADLFTSQDGLSLDRRQRNYLQLALEALHEVPDDIILVADNVRTAHSELAAILGVGATEEMLSALFGKFCIGK